MSAPVHEVNLFEFNKADRLLTSEFSMLSQGSTKQAVGHLGGNKVGFQIQGKGKTFEFYLAGTTEDADGDMVYQTFLPMKGQDCPIKTVIIFND